MILGSAAHGVSNAGRLSVQGGTLTVAGAVTGEGIATLEGGVLNFVSSFDEDVTFFGSGTLPLASSQAYAGHISDFSTTGSSTLDLADIGFVSSDEATFSGNAGGGVLTVTDGTHTAHIHLEGDYLGSTWVSSSDNHGGVMVIDPRKETVASPNVGPPPSHAFVAAMASLGARPPATFLVSEPWSVREAMLGKP